MTVKTSTIVRTVVLAITLLNTILTMLGVNPLPFSEEELFTGISAIATVCATLWAWWKNNSFTKAAIEADEVLEELRANQRNER